MIKPVPYRTNPLYLFGLILLVSSLPLSLFLTSLSQFILAGSFFLEGNFVHKFRRFFQNKTALVIAGIWLMHVIGLLYTTDFTEAMKDLRIKLPLLIFPVVMAGNEPLTRKHFNLVMFFFIGSVFVGTMVSMAVLAGIVHHPVQDIRDIFIFHISHIRFALFLCVAIFTLCYFVLSEKARTNTITKIVLAAAAAWFITFLVIMESVTGLSILMITATVLLLYSAFTIKKFYWRIVLLCVAIMIPVSAFIVVNKYAEALQVNHPMEIDHQALTAKGNSYSFDTLNTQKENGYPIWIYVCEDELRSEWGKRSKLSYDSLDLRGQQIKYTLIRFLTSKGFRKDAEAVVKLGNQEVLSIENGIANVNYQKLTNMNVRLTQVLWECGQFMKGGNPSGHSVTQRIEFWKTAVGIISEHPLIGVGTGDMPEAYRQQYEKMHSPLSPERRMRAHNQFLAITVAFGIAGLVYFLFALFYPLLKNKKHLDFFYFTFWLIVFLSMFTEDTLETEPGATFFGFFSGFFLFGKSIVADEERSSLH